MSYLKKIWNDPVGSKVIAGVIAFICTIIWSAYSANHNNIDFGTALLNFWLYEIPLWIIAIGSILIIATQMIFSRQFKYSEETFNLDKQVYENIKTNLLPQNGSISFLRSNNFAGFSFNVNNLNDIDNFEHELSKSDFYFINPKLESIRIELADKIKHFTTLISINTFYVQTDFHTVPPEWETEQPDRFWQAVKEIHSTSTDICKFYDELIKTGRITLKI